MPTVYIPQLSRNFEQSEANDALEQAGRFGKVVVLTERSDDVRFPEATIAKFKRLMRNFSDDDFLLPMGSHHFMLWAGLIAASKVKYQLQTLQWDIRDKQYRSSTVNVRAIGEQNEEVSYQVPTKRGITEVSERSRGRR